ncbi:MAG: protein-export chaperone SecB [Clostridia bacterium]|nr:protein-export chaperone SecB [Clostridia bacterium]
MNYALKGITFRELSVTTNPAFRPTPGEKTEFKQEFRVERVTKAPNAENIYLSGIRFEMKAPPEKAAPYDVVVHVAGVFEAVDVNDANDMQTLQYATVNVLLPALRAAVANLLATAMLPPVQIPLIPVTRLCQQPGEEDQPAFKVKFDESLLA